MDIVYLCIKILKDASFFSLLIDFDKEIAASCLEQGCRRCKGKLHQGHYRRKVRGVPRDVSAEYSKKFSYCCSVDGCRKRHTPDSLRFCGRTVYTTVATLIMVQALEDAFVAKKLELKTYLGVSRRTVGRWRIIWLEKFRESIVWHSSKHRFVSIEMNPFSISTILAAFTCNWTKLLQFLALWHGPAP